MPATELSRLILSPPSRLTCSGETADVGARVYLALAILSRSAGRVSAESLCVEVWGVREVARRTLSSLCHRTSEKLAAVGSPLRCGVDGSDVWLY